MSYLSQPASIEDYGVVKIGDYITVVDGVISLAQDLSPDADVAFDEIQGNVVYSGGNLVVTSVTPSAGLGVSISNLVSTGDAVSFTVNNTGVLSLIAGPGITVSSSTGSIVVSATGADLISVYGTTTNYTATANDEYIGVSSTAAVTITLPAGTNGRVYYIKDEYGQGSGKIIIQPAVGERIDGKTNYVIGVPYQCVGVVFRAGGWWIV
jgi:hypothetical protein